MNPRVSGDCLVFLRQGSTAPLKHGGTIEARPPILVGGPIEARPPILVGGPIGDAHEARLPASDDRFLRRSHLP
jgi:hypothetical protein